MNPVLPGAPWLIAHRSMLGVNRPYKVTLNGQDYVLWQSDATPQRVRQFLQAGEPRQRTVLPRRRQAQGNAHQESDCGEIFALNNVSPHMQAHLSDGWICQDRGTITCPFHALEFDGEGRLHREGKRDTQKIAQPLKLTVIGDCVWAYGDCEPRTAIPGIVEQIASDTKSDCQNKLIIGER